MFAVNGPASPADIGWQTDPSPASAGPSLFLLAADYLNRPCPTCIYKSP